MCPHRQFDLLLGWCALEVQLESPPAGIERGAGPPAGIGASGATAAAKLETVFQRLLSSRGCRQMKLLE